MCKLVTLLCLFLLPSIALAQVDEFVVVVLWDDMSRAEVGYNRTGPTPPDFITGGPVALTPNIDAHAAAGFVHHNMKTSAICSPTRARLLDYGPTGNPQNPYGFVVGPKDITPVSMQIRPNWLSLIRQAQLAGYQVFYGGKLHLGTERFSTEGVELIKQMGVDAAEFIILGNPTNEAVGRSYADEDVGDDWETCKGHNLQLITDLDGNQEFTHVHSSDGVWGAASDYAAAQTSGKHLILISPVIAHSPFEIGTVDAPLECDGDTVPNGDWPPGSGWFAGATAEDVYVANIEYEDTLFGDFVSTHLRGYGTDTVLTMSDNGTPQVIQHLQECDNSPGKKTTPFVCGTTAFFAMAGPGIVAGKQLTDRLNTVDDVPATLLSLMGSNSVHPWGLDFSDCMTESNGQSATNCRHTRDSVTWADWRPAGGVSFSSRRAPNVLTTPADEYTKYEVASEVWFKGGAHSLLYRRLDVDTEFPMGEREFFYQINDGVTDEMYSGGGVMWASAIPGKIPEDGTGWLITATDDAKTALVRAHFDLDHQWDRDGRNVPRLGGGSF